MNYRWQKTMAAVALLLFTGCVERTSNNSTDKKPDKISYYDLTFDGKEVNLKGAKGSNKITSIGVSGDRSHIYFQAQPGEISSFRVLDSHLEHVKTNIRRTYLNEGGGVSFNKLISGPDDRILALSRGQGILEMKGSALQGTWHSSLNEGPTPNTAIFTAASYGSSWVTFNSNASKSGRHRIFGSDKNELLIGPMRPQGYRAIIYSSCAVGSDLYLYQSFEGSGGIIKYSGPLNGSLGSTENLLMSDAELEISYLGATAQSVVIDMAVVGRYLVAGKVAAGNSTDTGIAVLNLDNNDKLKPKSKEMGEVYQISPSSDNQTALIATDKGLVFFYDGNLINIADDSMNENSYKRLTTDKVSKEQPVAFTNDKPKEFNFKDISGAVHVGDHWLISTKNKGVFKIKMTQKQK